jgi:hypothetical protein
MGKRDVNGLFAVLCRHEVVVGACAMAGGERHVFMTFLLHFICITHGVMVNFVFYDIGCQYKSSWEKFLVAMVAAAVLDEELADKLRKMGFPIPRARPPPHHPPHSGGG